jgi:uncharacterized metal-binding protein
MTVRESKLALAEVAALLGTDTPTARTYLRDVQHFAGPVPFAKIVAAMRIAETTDAQSIAAVISEMLDVTQR